MKIEQQKLDIEDYLVILSILTLGFADLNGILPLNLSQFIVLLLFGCIILRALFTSKIAIPTGFLLMSFYIIFISFIVNINGIESLKTLMIFLIYFIAFYNYIQYKNKLEKLSTITFNLSFFIALIGVLQEIGYLLDIDFMYDFSYLSINNSITVSGEFLRVTSILTEPAHLAIYMVAGITIGLIFLFSNKRIGKFKLAIIVICSFFTFSLIVYLSLMIAFLFIVVKSPGKISKKIGLVFIASISLLIILLNSSESLQVVEQKVDSLFTLNQLDTNNLSSFAVISNLRVAWEKNQDGYILGTGLDSHSISYFQYIDNLYMGQNILMYLNYEDAASLYIRILSEFGIIGFILFLIFIFKHLFVKVNPMIKKSPIYTINRVSIIVFICYGIRLGQYVHPFFILIFCALILSNMRLKSLTTTK
jgi:O-antigen ligase